MRAGPRDRRIVVQVKSIGRNDIGEEVETWTQAARLWAQRVEGSKVTERFAATQTLAEVSTIFRTGYWPAWAMISPDTHRVVFAERTYDILGSQELGRKDGVELFCKARGEK